MAFNIACLVLCFWSMPAASGHRSGALDGTDAYLVRTFDAIHQGRYGVALGEIDRVVAEHPNFRLAHLIRGDLLAARTQPLKTFGGAGSGARDRVEELRAEALARLRNYRDRPRADRYPRYLLQLDRTQRHAIVVDSSRSRVYLFETAGDMPHLVADYYTSIGKRGIAKTLEGDQKTPIGVYYVTSSIPGRKLPDLYGWGAFPINYPNAWDRIEGRTGYGIWLHGVPSDTYARAPQASDGCVALANPDIEALGRSVQAGVTPVIIAGEVEWVEAPTLAAERKAFLAQIEAWRKDWESRDARRYLAHYSSRFRSDRMDRSAWGEHKRKVNEKKAWIKVGLSNLSLLRDPGKQEVMVVSFDQDYRSSNLAQQTRKRQYWLREAGRWRIVYEGPTLGAPVKLPESFPDSRMRASAR